jgi:hypothetical protein
MPVRLADRSRNADQFIEPANKSNPYQVRLKPSHTKTPNGRTEEYLTYWRSLSSLNSSAREASCATPRDRTDSWSREEIETHPDFEHHLRDHFVGTRSCRSANQFNVTLMEG